MIDNLPICINFSGGRSSALMTALMLERFKDGEFVVTFQNTGKEKEQTLDFIHEFEIHHNLDIVWLEYHPVEKFRIVNYETASRNGEPFEALIKKRKFLPNVVTRFCTGDLKVKVMKRYMQSLGYKKWYSALGIRADEPRRVLRAFEQNRKGGEPFQYILPLSQFGIMKPAINEYWSKQPFDLQLKDNEGNCDLCFLKGKIKLVRLIKNNPAMADWWITMENKTGASFIKNMTYTQLRQLALQNVELEFAEPEIECYCNID